MIRVCANVSKEVADYYRGCNIDDVVNTLLETFEFDRLPQMRGEREVELRINVTNEFYESMYHRYGSRSKKVSLGRLLEFGKNMDVLSSDSFKIYKIEKPEIDQGLFYLRKAIRNLKLAITYDSSDILQSVYEGLKAYAMKKNIDSEGVEDAEDQD